LPPVFIFEGRFPLTFIKYQTNNTSSNTQEEALTDSRVLMDRAFIMVLACLHSFEDSALSMAWSLARFTSSEAESFATHACDEGRDDVYVAIRPREEVVELKCSEGWALVAKANGMVGWTPKVYLTDLARK
jgi:hypothetical protein